MFACVKWVPNKRTMEPLSDELNDEVASYLFRRDAQRYVDNNRFGRGLSCSTGCPINHVCYPRGGGCLIGESRPGRPNCCQLDPTAHLMFVQVAAAMQRVAMFKWQHSIPQRGSASIGYIRDLGALIPVNTLPSSLPTFNEAYSRIQTIVDLNLITANHPGMQIPGPLQLKLIELGSKLFRGVHVLFRDNLEQINNLDRSLRDRPNVFIQSIHSPRPLHVPIDILSIARHIKIYRHAFANVGPSLTEQRLFLLIHHKLVNADGLHCQAIIDMPYTNSGEADFDPIVVALSGTRFRGYILCRLMDATTVSVGTHNGVTVSVHPSNPVAETEWSSFGEGLKRVLYIRR